jgi:hypothetical protein
VAGGSNFAKRAGIHGQIANLTLNLQEVHLFGCNDSIIEDTSDIDKLVPRGQQ